MNKHFLNLFSLSMNFGIRLQFEIELRPHLIKHKKKSLERDLIL